MYERSYKQEEKGQFLKDYMESGKSIRSYCEDKKLGKATLHRWLTKENKLKEPGFSAMEIRMPQAEDGLFASIELGTSVIRIYQAVAVNYLKELAG
jgi:transposase-like protein